MVNQWYSHKNFKEKKKQAAFFKLISNWMLQVLWALDCGQGLPTASWPAVWTHTHPGEMILCSLQCRQPRKHLKEQVYQPFDEAVGQERGGDPQSDLPWRSWGFVGLWVPDVQVTRLEVKCSWSGRPGSRLTRPGLRQEAWVSVFRLVWAGVMSKGCPSSPMHKSPPYSPPSTSTWP